MQVRPEYAHILAGFTKVGAGTQGFTSIDRLAATVDRILVLDQDIAFYGPTMIRAEYVALVLRHMPPTGATQYMAHLALGNTKASSKFHLRCSTLLILGAQLLNQFCRHSSSVHLFTASNAFWVQMVPVTLPPSQPFRMQSATTTASRRSAALQCTVSNVLRLTTKPKVQGIDTSAICNIARRVVGITRMAHAQLVRDKAIVDIVSNTMRLPCAAVKEHTAIPVSIRSTQPKPAVIRGALINLGPKAFEGFCGILRMHDNLQRCCATAPAVTSSAGLSCAPLYHTGRQM